MIHWLREVFGYAPTAVSIRVGTEGDRILVSLATEDANGGISQQKWQGNTEKPEAIVPALAHMILSDVDPTKLALYFHSLPAGVSKDYEEVLARCINTRYDLDSARLRSAQNGAVDLAKGRYSDPTRPLGHR